MTYRDMGLWVHAKPFRDFVDKFAFTLKYADGIYYLCKDHFVVGITSYYTEDITWFWLFDLKKKIYCDYAELEESFDDDDERNRAITAIYDRYETDYTPLSPQDEPPGTFEAEMSFFAQLETFEKFFPQVLKTGTFDSQFETEPLPAQWYQTITEAADYDLS